eukprot:1814245-Pleurochrysis_carterae.AAC.1
MAQAFPELKPPLHGGYAVSRPATGASRGWRQAGKEVATLRQGGRAQRDWLALLGAAAELLEENAGIPLAPQRLFPGGGEAGVWLSTSDASGVDGVG